MVDREGQTVADSISGLLDSMGSYDATTLLPISYGDESGQLPETIGGDPYTVNITADSVIIRSGDRMWMSDLIGSVTPQNLSERSFNLTGYAELETEQASGEHVSGRDFLIERARLDVSGAEEYVTLVYWDY